MKNKCTNLASLALPAVSQLNRLLKKVPAKKLRNCLAIGLAALVLSYAGKAEAAVRIWTGLGGNGNWSTPGNWDTGAPVNNDSVVFNNGTANGTTTNNIVGRTLASITFAGSGTGITLRGNAITLTGGISASQSIVDAQIYFDITLATNNQTFSVSGTDSLGIGGNINLNGLNLSVNATALTNAVILSGAISGTGNVTKNSGPGSLYFLGSTPNTFNGLTTVNAGVIFSGKSPGVAAMPGDVIIGNGSAATLHLANDNQTTPTANIFIHTGGLFDLNGQSNNVANVTFVDGGLIQTLVGGVLTLGGNVTLNGAATSANITGNLDLGTFSKTFTVTNAASTLGISAVIGGGNSGFPLFIAGGVTKQGLGNVTLSGANVFAGPVTVNDGTLQVNNNFALGTTGSAGINHDPTTMVNSNAVLLLNNAHITNEVLTLNSVNTNGALQDNLTGDWTGPITLNTNVYIEASSLLQINGIISGPGGFTKISANTLALTGNNVNSYAGTTTVNNGTLLLSRTAGVGATIPGPLVINSGTVRLGADAQIYSLTKSVTMFDSTTFDLNGYTDLIGPLDMTGAHITTGFGSLLLGANINVNGSSVAMSQISGTLQLANGTVTVTCADGTFSPDMEIDANISGDPGAGLIKNGGGEVSLSGTNSFSGPLTINGGDFWAKNATAFGNTNTSATVNGGGSIFLSGNVAIGAKPLTLNGIGAFNSGALTANFGNGSWAGDIALGSSSTINESSAGSSLTLSGKISGIGSLTATGPGTITLAGSTANTYIGNTIVTNGTLVFNKGVLNQTITGNLIVNNAGTVRLGANEQIADTANVLINAGGVFDTATFFESFDTLTGIGSLTFGLNGYIKVGGNGGSSTFDGIISGIGYTAGGYSVAKLGSGTLTLNGNNTFTNGAYRVFSPGKLLVNGSSPQAPVIVDSGSTFGGAGTVGTIAANGIIAPGNSPGMLTSSNVTFTSTGTLAVELTGPTVGTGYDQLNVRGTNSLANSVLQIIPSFISPATIGQQFTILNNDNADAVTGTFNGLPQGATVSVGGYKFTISYTGGTGNDVVLTLADVPVATLSASIASGDGSHTIDPNECNSLNLVITNKSGALMSAINTTLSTTTPGVIITQPYSTYANLAVNGNGTNATAFQISTLPSFICGTDISLQLIVDYGAGSFVTSFTLHTGGAASSPLRYDNNVSTAIPDIGTINSTNVVAGFTGPLEKVTVSLYLTHTFDSDLNLSLISPDGTIVPLTIGIGSGADFGSSSADANRTTFDDSAATLITASVPPYIGTFRPQTTLASLIYNGTPNGNWKLRVTDNFGGSLGTLRNWSLFLYPVACNNGGGVCDPCLSVISNSITGADLIQAGRWITNFVTASCGAPKVWPGLAAGAYHYDIYTFTNTSGADACVTVQLQSSSNLMATAYLNSFNAGNIITNYIGDAGDSTHGDTTTFSSTVPNGGTLLVTVNEVTASANPQLYTLTLYGLPCPPPTLAINKASPANSVRVHWPTWAGGYQLESITSLTKTNWVAITNEPLVNLGRFNVTNTMNSTNAFYRLHKP